MTELENRALAFLQSHTLYDECRDEYYKDKSDFELLADFAKQEIADLEKELKKWKDEWQEQVQKATDEGYARTLQTIQLSKAKEHIQTLISCLIDWVQEGDKDYCYISDAEQFLKENE